MQRCLWWLRLQRCYYDDDNDDNTDDDNILASSQLHLHVMMMLMTLMMTMLMMMTMTMITKMKTNLKYNILASSQLHHHVPGLPVHVPSLQPDGDVSDDDDADHDHVDVDSNWDNKCRDWENHGEEGNTGDDDDDEYLMLWALSQPRPPDCVSELLHAFIRNSGVKTMIVMIRRNRRRRKIEMKWCRDLYNSSMHSSGLKRSMYTACDWCK